MTDTDSRQRCSCGWGACNHEVPAPTGEAERLAALVDDAVRWLNEWLPHRPHHDYTYERTDVLRKLREAAALLRRMGFYQAENERQGEVIERQQAALAAKDITLARVRAMDAKG